MTTAETGLTLLDNPSTNNVTLTSKSWNPAGTKIVYSHGAGGIYEINIDGTGKTTLYATTNWHKPNYNSTSDTVVFYSNSLTTIATLPSGTTSTPTTIKTGTNLRLPHYTPDDSQIIYTESHNINIMPVGGGTSTQITGFTGHTIKELCIGNIV